MTEKLLIQYDFKVYPGKDAQQSTQRVREFAAELIEQGLAFLKQCDTGEIASMHYWVVNADKTDMETASDATMNEGQV